MTGGRAHPAALHDPPPSLLIQYGRSGAWARVASQDAQRLMAVIEEAAAGPQAPDLWPGEAEDNKDGGEA
jgi:hypothetical protein